MGLVEEEWLVTLPTLDLTDMIFSDFIEAGERLSQQLRDEVRP